ncbi:MAG: hypothetical protein J7623_09105 [Chitinophaga sp.]|uniref:hypothetical protein n=1 Tax=Chitinophaga sp. TaxID=1869181 RepID=UPI001AFF2FF6|nr:hypothetical protein [Chitinophaga sp.]MBO9728783.1 hypothetical protein [Chitinophaga sp.]
MSANNIDNDFFNQDHLPIPIPPVQDAWADMERRLNATPPKKHSRLLFKAAVITGTIAIAGLTLAIAYHFIFRAQQKNSSVPEIIAPDNRRQTTHSASTENMSTTDTLQRSSFSQNNGLPPASASPATNEPLAASTQGTGVNGHHAADSIAGNAGGHTSATSINTIGHSSNTGPAISHYTQKPAGSKAFHSAPNGAGYTTAQATVSSPSLRWKHPATDLTTADNDPGVTNSQHSTSPGTNTLIYADAGINRPANTTTHSNITLLSLPLGSPQLLSKQPPRAITTAWHAPRVKELPEWQLFLQWQLPFPLAGSTYYLTGPDGNNQFYRLLIPGIRGVRKWNAQSISLDLVPYTAQTYNNPMIRYAETKNADSSVNRLADTLHKEFGVGATILYHRRILSHWQIAAGIQFNYWTQQSIHQASSYYPPWIGSARDSSITVVKESIHRPELKIPLEVYYDARRWQAGVRVELPVMSSRSDSLASKIKTPVQVQLMLRYKLLPRRHK